MISLKRQHGLPTWLLHLAVALSMIWSIPSPAPDYTTPYLLSNQAYWYAMKSAQESGSGSTSSKMMQYMMMLQMMQAQANLASAQANKSNADRQEKAAKQETKEAQIVKMEVPAFKAPEPQPVEKGPDLSPPTAKTDPNRPSLSAPPIPEVNSPSELARQFALTSPTPVASPAPTPAPLKRELAKADSTKAGPLPGPGRTPSSVPPFPSSPKEESNLGYDNGAGPRLAGFGRPGFGGNTPIEATPAPGISADAGILSLPGSNRRSRGAEPEIVSGGGGGGGSGSDSGGRGNGDTPLSNLLSELFGPVGGPGGRQELVLEMPEQPGKGAANLFEYAGHLYRNLREEKKVVAKAKTSVKPVVKTAGK